MLNVQSVTSVLNMEYIQSLSCLSCDRLIASFKAVLKECYLVLRLADSSKVQVKFNVEQVLKDQRGSRRIALFFL